MKPTLRNLIFASVSVLFFVILCFSYMESKENKIKENPYISPVEYYKVAEYQGKIAVFKNEENIPIEVYESYISVLPQHDRELLKDGIKVTSTEELQKVIEDYTS